MINAFFLIISIYFIYISIIKVCLLDKPCQNDGICLQKNEKSFDCTCINGYFGSKCEHYRNKAFINSTILNNKKELIDKLYEITNFEHKNWVLIYRATRDGFSSSNFHSKCNYHSSTLTLIKTTKSFVFGGFIEQSFSGCSCYKADEKAFLISLVNNKNATFKLPIEPNSLYAFYDFNDYGPTFGGGHDIYISSNSNQNKDSYNNPYSYILNGNLYESNLLAGEYNFQTVEIETYTII
jgi:hypothetical protein